MFMGEYNHTLDEKGRLIIPSKFRDELGHDFVVTKGLDNCLFVFAQNEWKNFEEKLTGIPITNKAGRMFSRFMLGSATQPDIDKQGRMLIPANLREYASITKDAILMGIGNRIEIWDKESWESKEAEDMDAIAVNMEDLGI